MGSLPPATSYTSLPKKEFSYSQRRTAYKSEAAHRNLDSNSTTYIQNKKYCKTKLNKYLRHLQLLTSSHHPSVGLLYLANSTNNHDY